MAADSTPSDLSRQAKDGLEQTAEAIRALLDLAHGAGAREALLQRALGTAEARADAAEATADTLKAKLDEAIVGVEESNRAVAEAEAMLVAAQKQVRAAERARAAATSRKAALPADVFAAAEPEAPRADPAASPMASRDEAPASQAPASQALAEAFRAWCTSGSAVVSKATFFGNALKQALPGATVAVVYRDGQTQSVPVVLRAAQGVLPAEYWAVAHGSRHWLLPQPLSAGQFRELDPCFDGNATPETLRDVRPAEVRTVGSAYEIVQTGRVSA